MQHAIGIDVGGTAIKGGVVSTDGDVVRKDSIQTQADGGVRHVIDRIATLVRELEGSAGNSDLALGLGVPGIVCHRQGIVVNAPNLDGWNDVPVVQMLSEATGRAVTLDNDANNAAIAEHRCGAGRGVSDMVILTLGTGIGSGIIVNREPWRGPSNNAGELGHMIVEIGGRKCSCGQSGCLETYASALATARRAMELVQAGEPSSLKAVLGSGQEITSKMVLEAAAAGDPLASRVWDESCRYLAVACINLQRMLDPERIILAGGMSAAGDHLRQSVTRFVDELGSAHGITPSITIAQLGNDAGFIGAGLSVLEYAG